MGLIDGDVDEGQDQRFTEAEIRTLGARSGLVLLQKDKDGGYMVFSTRTGSVIGGSGYDLTLDSAASLVISVAAGTR